MGQSRTVSTNNDNISLFVSCTQARPRNGRPTSETAPTCSSRRPRQAQTVELEQGDALFFHCRTFHAAGMNLTEEPKLSCVFTYHTGDNRPIPDTRSAQYPSIVL